MWVDSRINSYCNPLYVTSSLCKTYYKRHTWSTEFSERTIYCSLTTTSCREQIAAADSHTKQFIAVLNGNGLLHEDGFIEDGIDWSLTSRTGDSKRTHQNVFSLICTITAITLVSRRLYPADLATNQFYDRKNTGLAWIDRIHRRDEVYPAENNCQQTVQQHLKNTTKLLMFMFNKLNFNDCVVLWDNSQPKFKS